MKMKALPFLLSACLLFASAGCSAGNKGSSGTESTGGAESTSGESASESQPTEGAEVIDLNTLVEELSKDYFFHSKPGVLVPYLDMIQKDLTERDA